MLLLPIPVIYAKYVSATPLCVVIDVLERSSLHMFYAGNFSHVCIVPTPFMGFFTILQCPDESALEKNECCHSKNFEFSNCNGNRKSFIFLNNQDLERRSLNNNV